MLELASPRWSELEHAYGIASDIPALLVQLAEHPAEDNEKEPWFSIWSALAHQGDVYSASFAAVPHVIAALEIDPVNASNSYLHFPAWVEICRVRTAAEVPLDLKGPYQQALAKLPHLIALRSVRPWNDADTQVSLAAVAAAKGKIAMAEAILEMTSETAEEFMDWLVQQ